MACFKFGEIILPADLSVSDWSVIACDQYTSDKEYWEKLSASLNEPSALNLIFPECYLQSDNSERINNIIKKQKEYLDKGIFRKVEGTVLVHRHTAYGNDRWGLMCLIDLDEYSARADVPAMIRATEGLVESRIPPRVEIRKNCFMELPHVMLLIDDPKRTVIEPLIGNGKIIYNGELNSKGGHITGYNIVDTSDAEQALNLLANKSEEKYGVPLLFLVGDGNHSLATAKACRDKNNPLSRYALAEIVNIFDEGLKFEPIHRAVFDVNHEDFISGLRKKLASYSGKTQIVEGGIKSDIPFPIDSIEGVKLVQQYIDDYIVRYGGRVDYIHGESDLIETCRKFDAVGIVLKPIDKASFFDYVVKNGALPRKTFSMGEADEKRFYMEARLIKN